MEGYVDNAPVGLKNITVGDHVRIPISVISDWIYTDGEKVLSGFSVNALGRAVRG